MSMLPSFDHLKCHVSVGRGYVDMEREARNKMNTAVDGG